MITATSTKAASLSMMKYDLILSNVGKHIHLDEKEISFFISLLKEKQVAKKDFVLKEGQICRYISFVNSGILRAYYLDKEDKESTIMFAVADWWITDMYSYINQKPAMLTIQVVEDSHIFHLKKDDLEKLYVEVPKFEKFFRIIMQNAYIREQLRIIQNLSLSAEERYHNFLIKYPQLAKQVTQKQIASYLGVTPEFLSALRANKSKG
jgi:CRP/FNR family transcriptional regulator, anaerobic regulatory protein